MIVLKLTNPLLLLLFCQWLLLPFRQSQEYNDALMVTYLATITKGTEAIDSVVEKFNAAYSGGSSGVDFDMAGLLEEMRGGGGF